VSGAERFFFGKNLITARRSSDLRECVMKDGRILGGFTRKSYGLLHARASCCELADELTLAQLSNKMKHVSQAQIELLLCRNRPLPNASAGRAQSTLEICVLRANWYVIRRRGKRFSGNSGRRRPTHFVAVVVLVTASFLFSRNT
jgi:hypothetical protein